MKRRSYQKSKDLLDRASQVLAGGVSSEFRKYNHPHAIFYTHGEGTLIYDVDGNTYLDFTLSQGPLIVGHSHPKVLESVETYSREGQLFAGQHIKEIELAEKLHQLIPSAELMRFCLDGSEAVQTAFRVARSKTGKNKFLRFEGHYHGWLDNVAWGISTPSVEALGEDDNPHVFPWSAGLSPNSKDDFIILPWNDLELVERIVAEKHAELAAIITEPIMCNNGCIVPNEGFLQGLRTICDRYDIALIFDEVITGFRLGLGGAQGYYGITPDLSIFAKAIASGYPISAIVGKKEWMDEIVSARVIHAGTMNTSNPTVAAALATIEVLEEDPDTYNRMFRLGKKLKDGLRVAAQETGQNLFVQGTAAMLSTSFTSLPEVKNYRDTLQADKAKLGRFIAGLHDRGIRVIGRGLWYISAVHTEEDIDKAIAVGTEVLKEIR
ncbi:aspartate aminotransferase family protein [Sphingobacterium phlebotomi]|uniref:Aspartate aminotransferase family protein n=1 Tax=Sphingobacterium phlebotomi TaxID=2605433 RepID=A0A5D4H510_9SPHI|nr:aspartate aminotransferase family protein [Sphingobacterium phlebotomi]TYR35604.1 aspartate aminotransferase family protein [Sphingobacterium phlebotomi]